MNSISERYQVVVCGGGLAGFCAAVAAARMGIKTCIVQNRPVFGGNSSSEVRVTPHGAAAFHAYARETGILSELLIEERARNHELIFENGWTNSVWDLTMYDLAMQTPNLSFHVNTDITGVEMQGPRQIAAVVGRVQNAETELTIAGDIFLDCTGDGVVAHLAGCEWRMGTEAREEFNEPHAPLQASNDVMGNSIHFKTKNMGRPVPFKAPDWAVKFEDASYFYEQGRYPKDERGGFWWLEIGVPWHTIHQAEDIRHELTRHALGVWDWMKNKDPKMMDRTAHYALDWIGQVPGKRESRRILGQYFMTEHDPINRTVFPDEVAFGGWFIDLHTPGGLLAGSSEPANAEGYDTHTEYAVKSYAGPYGIPLRILISKDVENLMLAGRNVSVTHAGGGPGGAGAYGHVRDRAGPHAPLRQRQHHELSGGAAPALLPRHQRQHRLHPAAPAPPPLALRPQPAAAPGGRTLLGDPAGDRAGGAHFSGAPAPGVPRLRPLLPRSPVRPGIQPLRLAGGSVGGGASRARQLPATPPAPAPPGGPHPEAARHHPPHQRRPLSRDV